MDDRTIYTIGEAKLNKCELDILYFVASWFPTFDRWSVSELADKCSLFPSDAAEAVNMLILHGLMENAGEDVLMGRMVNVPEESVRWIADHIETINSLYIMNNTDLFDDTEIAEA
jgi:hypothetical protein